TSTYAWLRRRALTLVFGDARRGLRFSQVRDGLYQLSRMPMHPKNWRPTMLVLSGNPRRRFELVTFATWLEGGRGIVTLAEILIGDVERLQSLRRAGLKRLAGFIEEHDLAAYPKVVVAQSLDAALPVLLQSQGIGALEPNLVMLGWSYEADRAAPFARILRTVERLGMSLVVYEGRDVPHPGPAPRIDLWWRGEKNGALMVILAHLLRGNPEWADARLRILRVVRDETGRAPAEEALEALIEGARVEAEASIVVSRAAVNRAGVADVVVVHSQGASLVLFGLQIPPEGRERAFHDQWADVLSRLPPTLLVHSSGEADLSA
ncbi:MAG: hypothetical protein ACC662_06000, partial [Planctomycetota bacterium]